MPSNTEPVIIGTIVIVCVTVMFILLAAWSSTSISSLKSYLRERDKHYLDRITAMENLIKKEVVDIIKSIKKI